MGLVDKTPQFDSETTKQEYLANCERVIEQLHTAIHFAETFAPDKVDETVTVYRDLCARHDSITGGNIREQHGDH